MQHLGVAAGPPLPLVLVLVLVLVTEPADGLLVSGRRGRDRRLVGASVAETLTGVNQARCQLACHQLGNCRSFNYHAGTGTCQLFASTTCDSHSFYIEHSAGWTWFDAVADLETESSQTLWQREVCVQESRCRDACLRHLGQNCRDVQQCEHLVSGPVQCSGSVCSCTADHWQYNSTLCLPRDQQLFTDGEYWVWKKLVNGLCKTEFDIRAAGTVYIVLSEAYTHSANLYRFEITLTSLRAYRITGSGSNLQFDSSGKDLLQPDNFVRLGIQWCSGRMRLWQAGYSTMYISWNDGSPFSPTHMAIRSAPSVEGRWRFPENLVDPWFGDDWSAERVYSIPRDTWISRRRAEQDFWVDFECRTARDCNWMARQQTTWHNADIWRVIIGGWDNTRSEIRRHTSGVGWSSHSHVVTQAFLSTAEFRRFRMHFVPGGVSVYRDNETEPFMSVAGLQPFIINYDGPHMCCNSDNVEYKLVKFDAGWGYEGGFRWGENLVD